jgi:membrane fusion protein, macrolide-specific efflux system
MNLKSKIIGLPLAVKIIALFIILGAGIFGFLKLTGTNKKTSYQTETVQKGTLITSISASGTITSGDTTYITTGATGTVSKVYVKNGDTVRKNQKIAEISLDDVGQETQITAWNNYQEALVNAKTAQTQKETDYILVLQKKDALTFAETAKRDAHSGGWNPQTKNPYTENELLIVDRQYDQALATYNAAISNSSISGSNISLANSKIGETYRNYQKVSSTIYSPANGILQNLTLAPGVVIGSTSSSSITVSTGSDTSTNSQSVASKQIGAIKNPNGQYQATVSLTEVDVTKVQSGQKVTLTLDAFPESTFTGTVLAVNTSGIVSQSVTSYSATILLDKTILNLYTNMAVNATIIISSKTDVLLVTSTAIQTSGTDNIVQVQKNGKISDVTVEIGDSNDTQTEIKSGISEGDIVVIGTTSNATTSTTGNSTTRNSGSGNTLFRNSGGFGGPGF